MATGNPYDNLVKRGFVKQVTDEAAVRKAFEDGTVTAYVGFDPTARSLHVGHLLGLMALAHLQRSGHRPVAIIGDGTAMIGDPSGKTEMRKMLSKEVIEQNTKRIESQVGRYIKIDGSAGLAVRNARWLLKLNYIDVLREIGRHFSVNRMLAAEAYRARLETGLSFLEFNYQILQAYDFLKLYQEYDCEMQLGGDDQWGNILAGVDLIRRIERKEVQAITWPLLTMASGQKMGKTAKGAIWLDPEMTSPYEFYQYWINIDDRDVGRCLAYFTFLPMSEIQELAALEGANVRAAKERLAYEATKISHGEREAEKAVGASQAAFGNSRKQDLTAIPSSTIGRGRLKNGIPVSDLFVEVGLATSKSAARRLIEQGGAYVNRDRVQTIEAVVDLSALEGDSLILRAGKKRYRRILIKS